MTWSVKFIHLTRVMTSEFLTCFSTNPQLGVSVDFQDTDLKKAYRKAAMKVPDLVPSSPSI